MNNAENDVNMKLIKQKLAILNSNKYLTAEQRQLRNELEDALKEMERNLPEQRMTVEGMNNKKISSGPFGSFGEQLQSVAKSMMPGGKVDQRLYNAAGANETVPSEGGFLVSPDFSYDLLQGLFERGELPAMCNRFVIQGDSIKLPAIDETSRTAGNRWGGTRGYWVAEASEITSSQPKFRQLELDLKKLAVLCYASDEVISDASVLGQIIEQSFADEMSFLLNSAIVRGTGAGQPLGILNSGALVTVDGVTGQGGDTFIYENALAMWSRLLPRSKKNAVWLINQDIEPQLYSMSLQVGEGSSAVFMPSGGASASPYATLFGRPVIPCEHCSTLGTVGDIILADLSNGYILAEKAGGPKMAQSISVRFQYDEMAYRMTYRVDGQPLLASPITPAQGTNTQSHFVALTTSRND